MGNIANPLDAAKVGEDAGIRELVQRIKYLDDKQNTLSQAVSLVRSEADQSGIRYLTLESIKQLSELQNELDAAQVIIDEAQADLDVTKTDLAQAMLDAAQAKAEALAATGLASTASQEATDAWNKALAAETTAASNALIVTVSSSAGSIFKNTAIATTLTARVYRAGLELNPEQIAELGTLNWYKDGGGTIHSTGPTLTITAGEVAQKVTYECRLES